MRLVHFGILLSAGTLSGGADPLPPESRIRPEKFADLSAYSEGIVFDRDGTIFVSIRNPHVVLRIPPRGAPIPWLRLQAPNGHKILPDGTHWVAGEGTVVHVAPDGDVLDSVVSGRRAGCFEDPFGHQWWLAQHIKDMTPEEVNKAAKSHFSQMQPAS